MTRHGTSAPHLDDEPGAVMWQLRSATPEDCARLAEELLADIAGNVSRSDLDRPVLVFSRQGWHRGVLGIVAARLVDDYHKPVFVLSDDLDIAHGSGRSFPGINLVGLLESIRHHLEAFGGHEQAAGLALKSERIDVFREEMCLACGARQA